MVSLKMSVSLIFSGGQILLGRTVMRIDKIVIYVTQEQIKKLWTTTAAASIFNMDDLVLIAVCFSTFLYCVCDNCIYGGSSVWLLFERRLFVDQHGSVCAPEDS